MSQINLNNSEIVRPTLVSFFHGVGGMSKGANKAGFETLYATDKWDPAERAFHLNSCQGYFDNKDFFDNDAANIIERIFGFSRRQIVYGDIDAVVSGSPCQGMSKVNVRRSTYNLKNMLMLRQIRIAGMQGLGAKTAWFEQVPGFLDNSMTTFRNEVFAVLDSQTDYTYELRVLNAMNFGSFQSRDRVTIIMVRKDVGIPSLPKPQPIDLSKQALGAVLPYINAFRYEKNQTPKTAHDNIINTMTASGDGLQLFDGKNWRGVNTTERLKLSHLEGYDLSNFTEQECTRLMGNMVQIPFAEAIMRHIHQEILLKSPLFTNSIN